MKTSQSGRLNYCGESMQPSCWGLASLVEIKAAYRKRIKECHPDLFAGMDQRAMALAERWTRALNAAYSKLNPRNRSKI